MCKCINHITGYICSWERDTSCFEDRYLAVKGLFSPLLWCRMACQPITRDCWTVIRTNWLAMPNLHCIFDSPKSMDNLKVTMLLRSAHNTQIVWLDLTLRLLGLLCVLCCFVFSFFKKSSNPHICKNVLEAKGFCALAPFVFIVVRAIVYKSLWYTVIFFQDKRKYFSASVEKCTN